jgi:hypothetical protein
MTGGPFLCLGLAAVLAGSSPAPSAQTATEWLHGRGQWTDAARWTADLPAVDRAAAVRGDSLVIVPPGDYLAAQLDIGCNAGDRSRVEVDGGRLTLRQDSLRIGEYTGGEGSLLLKDGALDCAMDVFVGAATGTAGRRTHASLTIQGGSFVGLTLTVGEGLGCHAEVSVDGSRATAICAQEFVYLVAAADADGQPGQATLAFTLDEHGVTPITIQSRWRGLRIEHDAASRCRLRIALSAVPPREDITLVSSRARTTGVFDGLTEGGIVTARFGGRVYRWALTYQGGPGGHDLVLQNRSDYAPDAPVTHVRPPAAMPTPSWWGRPVYPLVVARGEPAFPGAAGYGASAAGGRGGRPVYVDNLNDAGPGSLRSALESAGPRRVVFRVGGTVILRTPLEIDRPFVTVDGGSAPAPGILLRRHGIVVRTHDVVLRQFRIRIGDEDVRTNDRRVRYAAGDGEYALYFVEGSQACIADHLSLSWSTNKILATTKLADRITVQWCILSESLNLDGHGYAAIAGGNRVSWHHNLFAHNNSRNARFQGAVDADFRNNVVYDWGEAAAYGEFDRLNFAGNYLKPGPSTTQRPQLFHQGTEVVQPGSLYLAGNVLAGNPAATRDNWRGTGFFYDRVSLAAAEPFPAPPVTAVPAAAAYEQVLQGAGATQPARDAVDLRVVREVRAGTGRLIQSVAEAGGWPAGF